jgi:putative membrane protein
MLTAGLVFAGLAALLHVYIFTMESLTWTSARTRAVFGLTAEEAETTKLLAFNQGFYNLFLALGAIGGVIAGGTGGKAIALFCCGCMVGAGLALIGSQMRLWRGAALQIVPAGIALLAALFN